MPSPKRLCRSPRAREDAECAKNTLAVSSGGTNASGDESEIQKTQKIYRETWNTLSGNQKVLCTLFEALSEEHMCCIMQEATSSIEFEDLPKAWPVDPLQHIGVDFGETVNTAKLECGHVFHAVALAFHFAVSDMRCPVCRSGPAELMNLDCVPIKIQHMFAAKIERSRLTQIPEDESLVTPLSGVQVLAHIELEMRLFGDRNSIIRTRVVSNEQHLQEIERETSSGLHASDHQGTLITGLQVHRSFQRLIRCVVSRQNSMNSSVGMQFALTHPLVPVSIASEIIPVSASWTRLFNPEEMLGERGSIELFCPGIGGTQAVACVHSQYSNQSDTPEVTIDVNMQMLVSISSYVNEILQSISESMLHSTVFDSVPNTEVSNSSINGIVWGA
jgi:hypothetical protein